jgi:outer membrane receptor protein involved in Fe transport
VPYFGHMRGVLAIVALIIPLAAQNETGQITGVVTNASNQPLSLASVTVTSIQTGAQRHARTGTHGVYNVPDLLPGEFVLEVSMPSGGTESRHVIVFPGGRANVNIRMGQPSAIARQQQAEVQVDSQTQTQQVLITPDDISNLPNLTRNPYQLGELAGNLSDAGMGTRGAGFAINGLRESSTNILLDGANNNNEFAGSIGQQIPPEAVNEFTLMTSNFTAEFGRASGGIVDVVSKRGGSQFHGTVYEFNRSSYLTSNSFLDNSEGTHEPAFSRNEFGQSLGGPIVRHRLFFFSSTEAVLVRSEAAMFAWVPSAQFLSLTAPNTQTFFQSLGQLRPGASVTGTINLNALIAASGENPCIGLACATLPVGVPLFDHVAYQAPAASGGGFPQNTADTFGRLDYDLSDRTWLYARYALYSERDSAGSLSNSPYSNYDLGQSRFDNTFAASAIHSVNPRWVLQSKVDFNRLNDFQQGLTSRGVVPTMYANPLAPVAIGTDDVVFPGYNPFTPGSAGAFGGPENLLQLQQDLSWIKGKHLIRFGGGFDTIRDNRTDAAYQTAVDSLSNGGGLGPALNGLLSGQFAQIEVAVNPQGKFPCLGGVTVPACSITLPAESPNFSRSNVFNEGALYLQDYWKVNRRLSLNLGLRWEHFGVQHDKNPNLDSNWYAPGIGFADNNLGAYLRNGGLELASESPTGQLWKPDWKDFAPRLGFAWDVFGNGSASLRGGYGIAYERNFGNVTFNVIQNLPNYAVLDVPGLITTNNFGPLGSEGSLPLPQTGARIIDPDLKTAYAHIWNASLEREMGRGIVYGLEYSGSKGVNLYSISYPNQYGFGNLALGDPCTGNGDCISQPNPNYGEDVGYRGNQGFSSYQGLNNRLALYDLLHLGIALTANYTWSHAIDNMSSTFFEAGGQGVASQYGNQNITINNGDFDAGFLDPYDPGLDKGNAEFDIRHRVTLAGNWRIPSRRKKGWIGALTTGWNLNPLFVARSGEPFSVFDTSSQTLDLSAPRASFVGNYPTSRNTFVPSQTMPDLIQLITFLPSQIAREPNPLTPGAQWPSNMSARDSFRAPGFWNLDVGIHRDTKLTDRFTLQIRAEFFNIFNHANLYVIGTSANVGAGNTVNACFGCTGSSYDQRQVQLSAKLIF